MNKPQIRFKGFDEEWKQSSFGEVCTVYDGVHQTPHYTDSGVMFVSVENIQTLQSTKFISLESFNSDFNIVPEKNDILMTRIGDIGTANIVQSDEPLAYYVSLALLKSPSIDSSFFKSSISCPDTKRELWKRTLHVAFPKKINKNEISLVGIKYPSSSEQKAIGLFFAKIDEMVAEAEREVSRLEKFKQASLQKMFPRPGAITPEIRFAGFSEPWDVTELGKVMGVGSVKRIHQDDWRTSGIRFLRARDIVAALKGDEIEDKLYISPKLYEQFSLISGKVSEGDILVTGVGTIGVPYLITDNTPLYFKDGNIIWFKNNNYFDGCFLFYSFISAPIQNYIMMSAGTGTVGTYTIESGKVTPISFPCICEQKKIGEYFRSLDSLISSKRQKLTKLRNIKQACLEKMFVNTSEL